MFGKLRGTLKLAKATEVVKEALRNVSIGSANFDVEALATRLVAVTYASKPALFDGKMGKPPHPLTTAAVALAGGLSERPSGFDEDIDASMFLALGNLLLSASTHSKTYGFANYDVPLLQRSEATYMEYERKHRDDADRILHSSNQ